MSTNQKSSKVERAERRRQERDVKKMKQRTYSFDEVDRILKTQINRHADVMETQTAVLLANVLEKEPYDFSRLGVCDVIEQMNILRKQLEVGEVEHGELLKVAAKHGVTVVKKESSVQVNLDRGDDKNEGDNDE